MVTLSSCVIWQIISFILPPNEYGCVYAWTTLGSGPAINLQKMQILAKKSFSQMKLILILAGMQTSKIVAFGAKKICTRTLKNQSTQNESLFGHFSSKMSKERPLQSMAMVIGPCWTNFCSQKFKRRILATFDFNRTPLGATQPKLHKIFCVLLLKFTLSAAELMSFGHFEAAIWHRCTIICGVPSKTSVTLTSQRQLTL